LSAPNKSHSVKVLIGVGSNIEPERNLPAALRMLAELTHVVKISSIWQTKAVGSNGPDYLNAAVLLDTDLPLTALRKDVLTIIEAQLGRERSADKYKDRTIDLDVLIYNEEQIDPELWTQAHVAVPAAQILPDFKNQETGVKLISVSRKLSVETDLEERRDLPWS
jgi:2-amino-4-hydroxy-6-hydroxymethyldihydropteridine diphosphokinase